MFHIGKKFKSTTRDSFILVKDFLSSFNEYQDSNTKSLAQVIPAPSAPDANEAENNDAAPAPPTAAAPQTGLLSSFFG